MKTRLILFSMAINTALATLSYAAGIGDAPAGGPPIQSIPDCEATYSSNFPGSGQPLEIASFGDSIMWGQGLHPEDRFTYLVAKSINQGGVPVHLRSFAHSGAAIDDNGPDDNWEYRALPGDIPDSKPIILHQITCIPAWERAAVQIVLVNGCADDFKITTKLPQTVTDPSLWNGWVGWINKWVQSYCGGSLTNLLTQVAQNYPNAHIVVTGYQPLIGQQSDPVAICAALMGITSGGEHAAVAVLCSDPAKAMTLTAALSDRSTQWYNAQRAQLQTTVAVVSRTMPGRFQLVFPGYGEANVYGGADSWLWSVNDTDPMAPQRQEYCKRLKDNQTCYKAQIFHPNVKGALAYSKAIMQALDNGYFNRLKIVATPNVVDACRDQQFRIDSYDAIGRPLRGLVTNIKTNAPFANLGENKTIRLTEYLSLKAQPEGNFPSGHVEFTDEGTTFLPAPGSEPLIQVTVRHTPLYLASSIRSTTVPPSKHPGETKLLGEDEDDISLEYDVVVYSALDPEFQHPIPLKLFDGGGQQIGESNKVVRVPGKKLYGDHEPLDIVIGDLDTDLTDGPGIEGKPVVKKKPSPPPVGKQLPISLLPRAVFPSWKFVAADNPFCYKNTWQTPLKTSQLQAIKSWGGPILPPASTLYEGMVVKGTTSTERYVVNDGMRHWIPDPPTFVALGFRPEQIKILTPLELARIPSGTPMPSQASPTKSAAQPPPSHPVSGPLPPSPVGGTPPPLISPADRMNR